MDVGETFLTLSIDIDGVLMPNKNYNRGRTFEYDVRDLLEASGYQAARTAGSHGLADVIGWSSSTIVFVQCKHTTKKTINLTEILKGDNIKKFELMDYPQSALKFLAIKQGMSSDPLILCWSEMNQNWYMSKF